MFFCELAGMQAVTKYGKCSSVSGGLLLEYLYFLHFQFSDMLIHMDSKAISSKKSTRFLIFLSTLGCIHMISILFSNQFSNIIHMFLVCGDIFGLIPSIGFSSYRQIFEF